MNTLEIRSTKTEILDAAERLFAAHGFEATSLRAITSEAGVNLGAVNYHFTSKDALILEVLRRRISPIQEARLVLLDEYEAAAKGATLEVEKILEALFRPAIELMTGPEGKGGLYLSLIGKLLAEPGAYLKPLIKEEFAENKRRFNEALQKAVPSLGSAEVCWKLHFAMGTFIHTVSHGQLLEIMSQGECKLGGVEEILKRVIAFCAAGFAAGGDFTKEEFKK